MKNSDVIGRGKKRSAFSPSTAHGHLPCPAPFKQDVRIRNELRPGDLGWIIHLHGTLYAAECGWDQTFEAYVAGPLAAFAATPRPRNRLWIVEHRGQVAGSIAIVELYRRIAQLRWFLLHPSLRGCGLGRLLLEEALAFSRRSGYRQVRLWTARNLTAAARLYRSAGFKLAEERTHRLWGQIVTEQRFDLRFSAKRIAPVNQPAD